MVYFDNQGSSPLLPEAREAMLPFLSEKFASPAAIHSGGLAARKALEKAREQAAQFVGARSPDEIIFTSNGAEAINLAIKGFAWANSNRGRHIICGAVEHPAVLGAIEFLGKFGFTHDKAPVDPEGRVDPERFKALLRPETILACVQLSNQDIGTLQPLESIGAILRAREIPLFVDASSGAGWTSFDVPKIGATLAALAPHRFHGPKGAGILYRNRRAQIEPLIHGGAQEDGKRAGMENLAAIIGAGVACEIATAQLPARQDLLVQLQRQLWSGTKQLIPHVTLNGPPIGNQRLCANLNISIEFVEGEGLALALDLKGFALATGAACVTKSMRIPPVLAAIQLPESLARGNIILSFGAQNRAEEVSAFLGIFPRVVENLREMSPAWDDFKKGLVQSAINENG